MSKISRQYEDLAWMIQIPGRRMAAKLVLLFLAKMANSEGTSYAGYRYNMLHTTIKSKTNFSQSLKYLRGLGLLSWTAGNYQGETNHYTLSIEKMRNIVKSQGLFDIETEKMKEKTTPPSTVRVPAPGAVRVPALVLSQDNSSIVCIHTEGSVLQGVDVSANIEPTNTGGTSTQVAPSTQQTPTQPTLCIGGDTPCHFLAVGDSRLCEAHGERGEQDMSIPDVGCCAFEQCQNPQMKNSLGVVLSDLCEEHEKECG